MRSWTTLRWRGYAVALIAMALSVWGSWLLAPFTEGRTAFLPLIPAVMLIAWYGGLGPGLFATALGAAAGNCLLLDPPFSFKIVHFYDWMRLLLFILCGGIVSILSQLLLQARQRAETARTQAEERLRQLRSSEELLRLMVAGVQEHAIFMLDPQGRVATWNAGAQRLKGYSAEEILGQPYARFFTPEDVASGKPQRLLEVATEHGQVEDEGWRVRKDGSRFWVDAILTAIRDEQGVLRGFAKVTRDMSERRRSEEIAEEARQAKQFIATLSHELRTPLTPILGMTATLEADAQLPSAVKEDLRMIRRNAELEARLVDDLLEWSRTASGKLNLHFEAVDAHAALDQTLQLCQQEIDRKHLVLHRDLQACEHYVWADPTRFRQMIWNLLKNAVKFTPDGGRITLASGNDHGQLVLQVTDTGIGIEPQHLPHIFEAYHQGDPGVTRQFGGLGLGLTICRSLVEAHGGTLTAASEGRHRGATFTLRLPVVQAPAEEQAAAPPAQAARDGSIRLLLVEDSEDTARVMTRVLRRQGYSVVVAHGVQEALKAFEAEPFDLLLSDLGLPDGTGWDLMRQITARRPVPAIAVSGYGTEADKQNSREAGFALHLTKPLDLQGLHEAIERLCA